MLGRGYALTGTVVKGDGRGRQIGFPTANIVPSDQRKAVPRDGVYAVAVRLPGKLGSVGGMMNIGVKPTFGSAGRTLEVHLMGLDEDLYGTVLQVEFVKRLRDEQRFDGVEALKEQLSEDRRRCTDALQALS